MNSETMKTLMGSESAEYLTPGWILDAVEKVAPIALDPCAHPRSVAIRRTSTAFVLNPPAGFHDHGVVICDGLMQGWTIYARNGELTFINPPYGRALKAWTAKMAAEPCPQIALVPARVDTGWWRQMNPDAWCALSGRVKFLSCQHEWTRTSGDIANAVRCVHCDVVTTLDSKGKPLDTSECPAAAPSETDPAPFPSAICLMHADAAMRARFVQVFKEHGPIYVPA
jgi:hypothetical protein